MRQAMPSIAGITWERLERESAVTYPCEHEGDPGERVVFTEDFPTENGKAKFVPAKLIPANERPDAEYPFILITGRQLEHWHTGSMTRRTGSAGRDRAVPRRVVEPGGPAEFGVEPGGAITVASRRGEVTLARARTTVRRAARCSFRSVTTRRRRTCSPNPVLDPFGKIPEFKYCAVRVSAGGAMSKTVGYGQAAAD